LENKRANRFCLEGGDRDGVGGEERKVAQTMYTHVSKCKNEKTKRKEKNVDVLLHFGHCNKIPEIIFYSLIHMCIHCLGHFYPLPLPLSHTSPHFQAGPVLPLSLILLKRQHKQ
jgi:hypothetical protein